MWIASRGKLDFNTLPILIICLIQVTDAKAKKKKPTTSEPPWKQTSMTSPSPSPSSHTSVPGSTVVIVLSVCVVLLIVAIALYLFRKWKQNKHAPSSSSNADHLNNRQLDHTAEDYEEIKDYAFRAALHAFHNNVDTPTDPTDSPTELERTAEDFSAVNDPELCSVNTVTEAPADPADPPADPTQSHEYISINFLPNSLCSELETAPDAAELETNE